MVFESKALCPVLVKSKPDIVKGLAGTTLSKGMFYRKGPG
jgi:hypothetical protein